MILYQNDFIVLNCFCFLIGQQYIGDLIEITVRLGEDDFYYRIKFAEMLHLWDFDYTNCTYNLLLELFYYEIVEKPWDISLALEIIRRELYDYFPHMLKDCSDFSFLEMFVYYVFIYTFILFLRLN